MAAKTKTADEVTIETDKMAEPVISASNTTQKTLSEDKPKQERVMYVGPTVTNIGIQNCVYTEIPADAKEVIKEYPEIGNLFIRIKDYPEANRMLREGRGYIYNAFIKAREIKVKNVSKINSTDNIETEERG